MAHTRLHTNIGRTYIRTYGATMAVCQQHCHSATWKKKDRRDDSGKDREDEVARYKNNNPKTRKKKEKNDEAQKAENKELELK